MRPIFLTGFMASGKTTLGRALARAIGCEFIDLDLYVENRFHRSIPALFEERGEDGFRALESAMLREVGEMEDVIVACGGGTPCHSGNMDYMKSRGTTLLLEAPAERLLERLLRVKHKRPLIARLGSDDEIREYIETEQIRRRPFYSQADILVESGALENKAEIHTTVSRLLDSHPEIFPQQNL